MAEAKPVGQSKKKKKKLHQKLCIVICNNYWLENIFVQNIFKALFAKKKKSIVLSIYMCRVITKNIIVKEKCPWFNGDIVRARKRRAAEKKWKRRKTSENLASYKSERNNVNYSIKRAKIDYYKRKIHEAGTDMGKLYFFLNTLVGGKNKQLLPENVSDARLANNFSAFFENKITDICAYIESNDEAMSHLPDIPYCKFDKFKEVTLSDTKDILSKAKKKKKKNIVKEILFQ